MQQIETLAGFDHGYTDHNTRTARGNGGWRTCEARHMKQLVKFQEWMPKSAIAVSKGWTEVQEQHQHLRMGVKLEEWLAQGKSSNDVH